VSPGRAPRYRAGERVGKFTLGRALGRGGMAEVWEAEGPSGAPVALKLMHAEDAGSEERRSRFVREARLLRSVQHPHVVGIRDVFPSRGGLVLVMDRLVGETLRRRLERGSIGVADTSALVEQLLGALDAIHGKGIVHRDLKPDNLFLVDAGGPRIDLRVLDFGIASAERVGARTLTDLTRTGAILGTPAYMSPEQLFGEEVDPRSDLWAVGILVHVCVTGRCPTEDAALGGVLRRVTKDPIPSIRALLPGPLADLVDAVLRKERAERPPSAAACLAILRGARPGPVAGRPSRRVLGAAGAVLLAVAAGTLGLRERLRPPPAPAPVEPAAAPPAAVVDEPPPVTAASVASSGPPPGASASARPTRHHRAAPRASGSSPAPAASPIAPPSAAPTSTKPGVEDIVIGP